MAHQFWWTKTGCMICELEPAGKRIKDFVHFRAMGMSLQKLRESLKEAEEWSPEFEWQKDAKPLLIKNLKLEISKRESNEMADLTQ
jgi:hypothetical protein